MLYFEAAITGFGNKNNLAMACYEFASVMDYAKAVKRNHDKYFSVAPTIAADIAGVSPRRIEQLVASGGLDTVSFPVADYKHPVTFVVVSDLQRWMADRN